MAFAELSTEFAFGEYMSTDAICHYLLMSSFTVTKSEVHCPNHHPVDRHEITRSSCDVSLSLCPGLTLQDHLDDLTVPLSRINLISNPGAGNLI